MTTPCQQMATLDAIKWTIGVLIIVGGCGIGFSITQANEAKAEASEAKSKASNVSVLENEVSHIRDDMKIMNLKLDSITDIKVTMAEMAGDTRLALEKLKQLERAE